MINYLTILLVFIQSNASSNYIQNQEFTIKDGSFAQMIFNFVSNFEDHSFLNARGEITFQFNFNITKEIKAQTFNMLIFNSTDNAYYQCYLYSQFSMVQPKFCINYTINESQIQECDNKTNISLLLVNQIKSQKNINQQGFLALKNCRNFKTNSTPNTIKLMDINFKSHPVLIIDNSPYLSQIKTDVEKKQNDKVITNTTIPNTRNETQIYDDEIMKYINISIETSKLTEKIKISTQFSITTSVTMDYRYLFYILLFCFILISIILLYYVYCQNRELIKLKNVYLWLQEDRKECNTESNAQQYSGIQ